MSEKSENRLRLNITHRDSVLVPMEIVSYKSVPIVLLLFDLDGSSS